uniref:Uncharacterized protein n=1 Tax=Anguilla anguilla TaxID=7936 RepID=A0A0E9XIX9_ANGAN
MATIQLNTFT